MTYDSQPRTGRKGDLFMNTQLHLALGIVEGRAWSDQDFAVLRDLELARQTERRSRRTRRIFAR